MTHRRFLVPTLSLVVCVAAGCGSSGSDDAQGTGGQDGGGGGGSTSGCRGPSDCGPGEFCVSYTLPPLCGGKYDDGVDNCLDDSECADAGADFICDSQLCVFPHGGGQTLHCKKGCTVQADCGPGLDCDATHRCVARSCSGAADCGGANFDCQGGQCTAKTCSADGECQGACVNGACADAVGSCQEAVP